MPISNGTQMTTIICCGDDSGCPTFAPISCDIQLQNNTANPIGLFKTMDFSPLASCAGLCCPHGYACNGTMCLLDDEVQSTSTGIPAYSLFSAALSESTTLLGFSDTSTESNTATTTISSILITSSTSPSLVPTAVTIYITTSPAGGASGSQSILPTSPSKISQPLPTTESSEIQQTKTQNYKKVIVPISVVSVAAWLFLVFGAWKILQRKKRKACEEKSQEVGLEKPQVLPKSGKSRLLRFELPGKLFLQFTRFFFIW